MQLITIDWFLIPGKAICRFHKNQCLDIKPVYTERIERRILGRSLPQIKDQSVVILNSFKSIVWLFSIMTL